MFVPTRRYCILAIVYDLVSVGFLSTARLKADKIAINKCSHLRKRLITDFKKSVDVKFAPYAQIHSGQLFSVLFQERISYSTIRIVREYMFAEYRRSVEDPYAANSYKQPTKSCGPINIHNVDPQMRT